MSKNLKTIICLFFLLNLFNISLQKEMLSEERQILNSLKNASLGEKFQVFHQLFKKPYEINSEEGLRRFTIFQSNLKKIDEINSKNLSYKLGITPFTDLTLEEYREKYTSKFKRSQMINNIRSNESFRYFDDENTDLK